MTLFFSMLPFYLLGNLHCFGMCGPVAMLLAEHPYRHVYFIGRLISFTLAGLVAGALGEVLHVFLARYFVQEGLSLIFGAVIVFLGIGAFFQWHLMRFLPFMKVLNEKLTSLSLLVQQPHPWAAFLMGFFTVMLPCGQSLIVFSACAVSADTLVGGLNAFAFALLTSPSLFFAMKAFHFFRYFKGIYNQIMGITAILVGSLLILRGLAQLSIIPHLVLNPSSPEHYHIIFYRIFL